MIRTIDMPLISNGYTLSSAPERLGWLTAHDPTTPVAHLRAVLHTEGVLWLKGMLDRDSVLDFRRQYFAAWAETGLLRPGTDPVDGFASAQADQAQRGRLPYEIVRWADYEAFCLAAPLRAMFTALFDSTVYLHKRKIIRHTVPGAPNSTGAHYDLVYLRGGTENVLTAWIPIGDTPVEMGGLLYLEGSSDWGRAKEAHFSALNADLPPEKRVSAYNKYMETGWLTKDLPTLADEVNARWLMADYEAGDVVIHSAYMIHAAPINQDPAGRLRLSTDIRYQRVTDSIDRRWANDWSPEDGL